MDKERILRKIYLTRKARILLSEELKSKHDFYQNLIIYYTAMIIIYSLLDITKGISNAVNILIMSIVLSFFTVAVQSQKHLERYMSLKQHYIKLDELYYSLTETDNVEGIREHHSRYIQMLDTVENHERYHYLKACVTDTVELENMQSPIKAKAFILYKDIRYKVEQIILLAIPLLIPTVLDFILQFFSTQ